MFGIQLRETHGIRPSVGLQAHCGSNRFRSIAPKESVGSRYLEAQNDGPATHACDESAANNRNNSTLQSVHGLTG